MAKRKKTRFDFAQMKRDGLQNVYLACYDHPTASLAERAGVDMLLVGDSLGMCVYGYPNTLPVTMDQCLLHADAVRRGAPHTFVVGDMPFLSYQESVSQAIHNAGRFYKESAVDAVKLEGGRVVVGQIRGIVQSGMTVMGHVGLTPQSSGALGGFRTQGKTAESAIEIVRDAEAVQEAGAFALVLEAVPPPVAAAVMARLEIPVYGIGAGGDCDGQILTLPDMIGLFTDFKPTFAKQYANVAETITSAVKAYASDVREGRFPADEHTYDMAPDEADKLQELLDSA